MSKRARARIRRFMAWLRGQESGVELGNCDSMKEGGPPGIMVVYGISRVGIANV
jgi:hypothetical protein